MGKLKSRIETRLRILELAAEIAAAAAQNTNVVHMLEFQEQLVERLYRRMLALVEEEIVRDSDQGLSAAAAPSGRATG
jgi:hypothetical protein